MRFLAMYLITITMFLALTVWACASFINKVGSVMQCRARKNAILIFSLAPAFAITVPVLRLVVVWFPGLKELHFLYPLIGVALLASLYLASVIAKRLMRTRFLSIGLS